MCNRINAGSSPSGIWIALRYVSLSIFIIAAIYVFGGPGARENVNTHLRAAIELVREQILVLTGESDRDQSGQNAFRPKEENKAEADDLRSAGSLPVAALARSTAFPATAPSQAAT